MTNQIRNAMGSNAHPPCRLEVDLTPEADPLGRPPEVRMRQLLKIALHALGLCGIWVPTAADERQGEP